jgi:hypothetical protein
MLLPSSRPRDVTAGEETHTVDDAAAPAAG